MSNLTEAKIDEGKLNAFVGQMLADLRRCVQRRPCAFGRCAWT